MLPFSELLTDLRCEAGVCGNNKGDVSVCVVML
jgi:hypothetical protein